MKQAERIVNATSESCTVEENEMNDGIVVTVNPSEDEEFAEQNMPSQSESEMSDSESDCSGDDNIHDQSFDSVKIRPLPADHEEQENTEMVERCKKNPYFMNMVFDMVKDTLKSGDIHDLVGNSQAGNKSGKSRLITDNQCGIMSRKDVIMETPKKIAANKQIGRIVKSPSDTTLYAPGLKKCQTSERGLGSLGNPQFNKNFDHENDQMIEKISQFVEEVCLETEDKEKQMPKPVPSQQFKEGDDIRPQTSKGDGINMNNAEREARALADKLILEAKCFKGTITAPKGRQCDNYENFGFEQQSVDQQKNDQCMVPVGYIKNLIEQESDDEFFHLTCHIEQSLRQKIGRGEFVNLERLLPQDRFPHKTSDERRMEMVNHDGYTYFVLAGDKESKINGIRKWEQAFRIYAAIYCKENPARSAEIWQYVYVINTAAASFQWENVAWYDYTFRQVNGFKTQAEVGPKFTVNSGT